MFKTLGLIVLAAFLLFAALVVIALSLGAFYIIVTIEKLEKEHRIETEAKDAR